MVFSYGIPPLRPLSGEEVLQSADPILDTYAPALQLAILLLMEHQNTSGEWRPWLDLLPQPSNPTPNALFLDKSMVCFVSYSA